MRVGLGYRSQWTARFTTSQAPADIVMKMIEPGFTCQSWAEECSIPPGHLRSCHPTECVSPAAAPCRPIRRTPNPTTCRERLQGTCLAPSWICTRSPQNLKLERVQPERGCGRAIQIVPAAASSFVAELHRRAPGCIKPPKSGRLCPHITNAISNIFLFFLHVQGIYSAL